MFWFLDDPARLVHERRAIEYLFSSTTWLTEVDWNFRGSQLTVDADIESHETTYPLRMIYPRVFPASPPSVISRDVGNGVPFLSSHSYRSGELCLEWGADTWVPEVTGAQLLESAKTLLDLETVRTEVVGDRRAVPSRHELTAGQELRGNVFRFMLPTGLRRLFDSIAADDALELDIIQLPMQEESVTVCVRSIRRSGETLWNDEAIPIRLATYATAVAGVALRCTSEVPVDPIWSRRQLLDAFGIDSAIEERLRAHLDARSLTYLLVSDTTNAIRAYHLSETGAFSIATFGVGEYSREDRIGPPVRAEKRVGIVGLGSAGSKIAVSLARTGVTRFVLVDDDLMAPENLVRNDLDWRNVGEHKVGAVAERLMLVAPDVHVKCHRARIAGQESNFTSGSALTALANCDLIIDATADPRVFNVLSMVATQSNCAFIWLEVFGGGLGGLVARHRPGYDAHPAHMRQAFNAWSATTLDPPKSANRYDGEDDDGQVLVGIDADVTVISAFAVQFAIDSLREREPPAFQHSLYLIGFRRGWEFDQPYRVIPIDTGGAAEVEEQVATPDQVSETVQFVSKLLAKQ